TANSDSSPFSRTANRRSVYLHLIVFNLSLPVVNVFFDFVEFIVTKMEFRGMDLTSASLGNKEPHRPDRRNKTQYYIETIFKPPEKLTCTYYPTSDNCKFPSESEACSGFVVLDFASVFERISLHVRCKICTGAVIFSRAQMVGLGFKLVLECRNCGELDRVDSSKIIGPTSNDYEINARNEQACQFLASTSSNMQSNLMNDAVSSQEPIFSGSPFAITPKIDMRSNESGGSVNFQNTQNFFPSNEWQNHNAFGREETNLSMSTSMPMPMATSSNWQMGSENDVSASDTRGSCGNDSDGEDDDEDEEEGNQQQNISLQSSPNISQQNENSNSWTGGSHKPRRKVIKASLLFIAKQRAEGQRLTSDTPLPNFSSYVLAELAKPAPKMSVVLPPCKAYIVAVTGDEYPTKKEYEIFSLKMILAYPSLRDPDTEHGFERFKKSLSSSFRARRSYEKNIRPGRLGKKFLQSGVDPSSMNLQMPSLLNPNHQLPFNQPSTSSLKEAKSEEDWNASSDSDASEHSGNTSHRNTNAGSDNDSYSPRKKKPRRVIKKQRAEGQRLTSETPLPDFSIDVLTELSKPAPRMSVVLPTCKAHIVAVTGDEYPTKKEYEIFSLQMVTAFPSLRDPDTELGFERFKKSLSASFRARRSYEKNIKPVRQSRKSLALEPLHPSDVNVHLALMQPSSADEEMRLADEQLSSINFDVEPDRAKYLIEKSFNYRKRAVATVGFDESVFLQTYKHLSNCDLLVYEYSLLVNISVEDLRNNFNEGLMVLTKMFWNTIGFSNADEDLKKVQVMVHLQEHFLNQKHNRQDTKPKPLFVIKNEMAAFNDGDNCFRNTQIPCALVLTNNEGRISKLMITYKDNILVQKPNATAFDACSSLLAFFFILNIKYPQVYLDNLKALERLLNRKLCFSSLQTTISSPYSNYVKLYDATLKELQQYIAV
ncbi:Glycine--tRNA ligase beta subunit, partial [Frankliniella fusca]